MRFLNDLSYSILLYSINCCTLQTFVHVVAAYDSGIRLKQPSVFVDLGKIYFLTAFRTYIFHCLLNRNRIRSTENTSSIFFSCSFNNHLYKIIVPRIWLYYVSVFLWHYMLSSFHSHDFILLLLWSCLPN